MPLKQIFIQNSSYISYSNNNISIKTSKIDTKVCLDDIDIIVIDNQQTTISTAILVKLAQANICTIFIDDKHNPSSILTPLYKNSKTLKIQKAQLNIKKPKLNSLWKDIIKSKILNQAHTLDKLIKDRYIYSQIKRVV